MYRLTALTTIGLLVLLMACSGSSSNGGGNTATPVKLNMTTASSLVGQGTQFSANVPVTWTVEESNGGTITSEGLYSAPQDVGVFHVIATSTADKTQTASAAVDVSAQFLSLQKNLAGTAQPYSVSPVINTLKSDAQTFTSTLLTDPSTNAPFDTNAFDIMISPDGTKAVATVITRGLFEGENYFFYNIVVASANGSTLTQITHNENITSEADWDMMPEWSPDGKLITFIHRATDPQSQNMLLWHIATMRPDGSDLAIVFPTTGNGGAEFPAFSPDGKKIAAEMWYNIDHNTWADGIGVVNVDGTGLTQLTGGNWTNDNYVPCSDTMPTFMPDGKKIVFVRECWPDTGGYNEQLYSINVDGTHLAKVWGSDQANMLACQPRAFTNKTVAVSSNHEAPAGTDAFDMYVVKTDGTGLTRVTNNVLYDGFSVWWINWNEYTSAARVYRSASPRQMRLDHHKMLLEHRGK